MSAKPKLVLWGASGHASVVADIVRLRADFVLAGFLDDTAPEGAAAQFCGAPLLGGSRILPELFAENIRHLIVAIGDCRARLACAGKAADLGFAFARAIHPAAVIAHDVEMGPGAVVMAGAVVNPATRIGAQAIINTGASVDHHCVLDEGVHVSPGARLAGGVSVGRGSWIGLGALIKEKVCIGRNCVVGAGALVLKDVADGATVWGAPAAVRRISASQ